MYNFNCNLLPMMLALFFSLSAVRLVQTDFNLSNSISKIYVHHPQVVPITVSWLNSQVHNFQK